MKNEIIEDKRVKCNVTITFKGLTNEQREHLYEAEKHLGLAGVSFDRGGYVCEGGERDWEFDYSLSDNVSVYLRPSKSHN